MLQNTLATSLVSLLDLPTEVHHKIKEFLGPKHALIPAHTCRTLFTIYGHDYIWEKWLQTEYQQPPLKQLSNDKFTFTTRKIYQLKVENDTGCYLPEDKFVSINWRLPITCFPMDLSLSDSDELDQGRRFPIVTIKFMTDSLISQGVVNQEDASSLLEFEIIDFFYKFSEANIKRLYSENFLSLNDIQHLTEIQSKRLEQDRIVRIFSKNLLSLDELQNLSDAQFDRLCEGTINWLFISKLLSLNDIKTLPDEQLNKFNEYYVYCAFIDESLSLEDVINLTPTQIKRFNIQAISVLFVDKLLSLQDLENLTDVQVKKLCDPDIEQRFRNGQLALVELETYTP